MEGKEDFDRLHATIERLEVFFERAKDGDPAALQEFFAQCQAVLDQIYELRAKK